MRTIQRFSAAVFLGVLAGMLSTALHGAWLVHDERVDQAARSARLHDLGRIAVPRPEFLSGMTWRDDLAAGLFYGGYAGWPLGGLLALMVMGLDLEGRSRAWVYVAAALLFAAIAFTEAMPGLREARAMLDRGNAPLAARTALDALREPVLWILLLAAVELGFLALPPSRARRGGFLLVAGGVLVFLLHDPIAPLSTAFLALLLPWIVAGAVGLAWRPRT